MRSVEHFQALFEIIFISSSISIIIIIITTLQTVKLLNILGQ